MKRITIERYKNAEEVGHAGLIEGETDSGEHWVLFLDAEGKPSIFWPKRGEEGDVIGDPMRLDKGYWWNLFENLHVTPEDEKLVTTFPIWETTPAGGDVDGMRGVVFAVVPGEGTAKERMTKFLKELYDGFTLPDEAHTEVVYGG